jgi:4-aminobutyrate aminotransferase-like enzyme
MLAESCLTPIWSVGAICKVEKMIADNLPSRGPARDIPLAYGVGSRLYDVSGASFLDFTSSFGTCSIGYGNPTMIDRLKRQVGELWQTMSDLWPHQVTARAEDAVLGAVGRVPEHRVFFVTSGSEAIELAWKLAVLKTGSTGVLCFEGAFHGQVGVAQQVTSFRSLRSAFPLGLPVGFLPYPLATVNAERDKLALAQLESQIKYFLAADISGGFSVGAIIVEPMQNLAGYRVPVRGFLRSLRSLCDRYGILLIFDEVFTGFGRTGHWLASDAEQTVADVICVGKGMLGGISGGACIAHESLLALLNQGGMLGLHGSTFKANPLTCTAAVTTIEALDEGGFVDRVYSLESLARQRLSAISNLPTVSGIYGRGLALGIAMRDPQSGEPDGSLAAKVCLLAGGRGLNVICNGYPYGNVICICPPLVIDETEFYWGLDLLIDCVAAVDRERAPRG